MICSTIFICYKKIKQDVCLSEYQKEIFNGGIVRKNDKLVYWAKQTIKVDDDEGGYFLHVEIHFYFVNVSRGIYDYKITYSNDEKTEKKELGFFNKVIEKYAFSMS